MRCCRILVALLLALSLVACTAGQEAAPALQTVEADFFRAEDGIEVIAYYEFGESVKFLRDGKPIPGTELVANTSASSIITNGKVAVLEVGGAPLRKLAKGETQVSGTIAAIGKGIYLLMTYGPAEGFQAVKDGKPVDLKSLETNVPVRLTIKDGLVQQLEVLPPK